MQNIQVGIYLLQAAENAGKGLNVEKKEKKKKKRTRGTGDYSYCSRAEFNDNNLKSMTDLSYQPQTFKNLNMLKTSAYHSFRVFPAS